MNKRLEKIKKSLMILAVVLTVSLIGVPVHAMTDVESEGIDPNQNGSGSIIVNRASDADWPVRGTVFHLYQVADLNDDMTFSYTEEFKNSKVALPTAAHTPNSSWEDTTKNLVKEVNQNHLEPSKTITWTNGSITFNNLDFGLYLLTTDEMTANGKDYVSQGNLISVPNRDDVKEDWKYSIPVEVKYSYTKVPPTPTPSPKTPEKPDTGDHFNEWLYAGIMIAMGVVIGIIIYVRSERRKD